MLEIVENDLLKWVFYCVFLAFPNPLFWMLYRPAIQRFYFQWFFFLIWKISSALHIILIFMNLIKFDFL
jgi:hypothetical protein